MTVEQLISKLNKYPKDADVIVDSSSDYQSYDLVKYIIPGDLQRGMCTTGFEPVSEISECNSVLLAW